MKMRAKKQHIIRNDNQSHRLFDYRRNILNGRRTPYNESNDYLFNQWLYQFTDGSCHVFAAELSRKLKIPMTTIFENRHVVLKNQRGGTSKALVHCYLVIPGTNFTMCANGVLSKEDLFIDYGYEPDENKAIHDMWISENSNKEVKDLLSNKLSRYAHNYQEFRKQENIIKKSARTNIRQVFLSYFRDQIYCAIHGKEQYEPFDWKSEWVLKRPNYTIPM